MPPMRHRAIGIALFACLFLVNVQSAFATHFRYGTISWEKVLAEETATTIRVRVTFEASMRWSFPWGGTFTSQCGTTGACPPVGTVLTFSGNIGSGTIAANGTFSANKNIQWLAPGAAANTATTGATRPFTATVTSVNPSLDLLTAQYVFDVIITKTLLPVTLDWNSSGRVSTILEGNNDLLWRLQSTITNDASVTKSPRSASLPMITVRQNALNTIQLPNVAFDNTVNKWRFSTTAESGLNKIQPTGMTLDTDTGIVSFTPLLVGPYAAQFNITAYDPNTNTPRVSVPLDLMFVSSAAPPPGAPTVQLTTPSQQIGAIGTPMSFAVTSTLTPNTPGFTGYIQYSPLPTGATLTAASCTAGVCTSTFNWTPTITSTGTVVCFQGLFVPTSGTMLQSQQSCVPISLGALATTTVAFPASGVGGGPVPLSARVTRVLDGSNVINRNVVFSWADTGEVLGTGLTNTSGIATISPIIPAVFPSGRAYVATFQAVANEFLQSSATNTAVVVAGASGSLLLAPAVTPVASVGIPLTIRQQLNRVLTPSDGGTLGINEVLNARVTPGLQGASFDTAMGVTGADGIATITFTTSPQAAGGTFTAFSRFEGSTVLAGNVQSPNTVFTVYQRVQLSISAPTQVAPGQVYTVNFTLLNYPQGTPVSGKTISYSAPGSTASVTTNAAGQATATVTAPATLGPAMISASYALAAGQANSQGLLSTETATRDIVVGNPVPTAITASSATSIAGQATTLSATLKRTDTQAALVGETVAFSVVGGSALGTAITNASGIASLTYTPSAQFAGSYRAQFTADGGFAGSSVDATLTINKAATGFTPLVLNATSFVGESLSVSTSLTRLDPPGGALSGVTVAFNVTGATTTTVNVTTDANGNAVALIPLTGRGAHTITASYAGTTALNAASRAGSTTAYQKTRLVVNPVNGVATETTTVTASLQAVPGNAPINGQTVSFSFTAAGVTSGTAVTSGGSASVLRVFPAAGTSVANASFNNLADFFVDENGNAVATTGANTVTITTVVTALSAVVATPSNVMIGNTVAASTTLSRQDGGTIGAGWLVTFTMTLPGGSTIQQVASTAAGGAASTTFPALTLRGVHSISASYAGTTALTPSTSPAATVTAYNRSALSTSSVSGSAGSNVTVSATLTNLPAGVAIVGQTVAFDFGGVIVQQTATTNAAGVASVIVSFPNAGSVPFTASFINAAAFYADSTGAFPIVATTAGATATISSAVTALSQPSVPSVKFVGDTIEVSSTLTRTTAPAGPINGATVTFNLTGASSASLSATTNSSGVATVTFPVASTRGMHSVTASYAGSGGLNASTSAAANMTVYQRTALVLNPASGPASTLMEVSAKLVTSPGNVAIANAAVQFSFFGAIANQTMMTDAAGEATTMVSFPNAGFYSMTASFIDAANFYADSTGAFPIIAETAFANANVSQVQSALSTLTAPNTRFVGDSLTVSTTLTRTTPPVANVPGAAIAFTISGPTTETLLGTTDNNGVASVTFPAFTQRGSYSVTASYTGDAALVPSTSAAATVVVYQRTALAMSPVTTTAGTSVNVSATLTTIPDAAALANQSVTLSFGGAIPDQVVSTNASGIAATQVTFPNAGSFPMTATLSNAAGFYADSTGAFPIVATTAGATATINSAATSLSAVSTPNVSFVGNTLVASTMLTRTAAPAGALNNRTVTFTLTAPGGGTSSLAATTDVNGIATVTFPVLTAKGAYTISASFAATSSLSASVSGTSSINVYQKTTLTMPAVVTGVAGGSTALTATLTTIPGGTPVAGQVVNFAATNGMQGTAVTDINGLASVSLSFPNYGQFTATGSFVNAAGFYADSTGAFPVIADTDSSSVTISAAQTSLAAIAAPSAATVGSSFSVSTVLTRTSAPAGPINGAMVTFEVTAPGGAVSTLSATTDSNGFASVTIPAQTVRGTYTIAASYAGSSGLAATAAAPVSVTVYQRASLTMAPVNGLATAPITISASLANVPGNTSLGGQTISFAFSGPNGPAAQTAVTNGAGVASVTVAFPSVAVYTATATFSNAADFFTNNAGALPAAAETATASIDVRNNAPTFTAPLNITQEATGPNGRVVTFNAMGDDIEQGPLAAVCAPSSGSTFPVGATTVNCTVTDSALATATGSFIVTIQDTTAPTLTLPVVAPQSAASPQGREMTYSVSATDIVDTAPTAVCVPPSGSIFATGTTTVTCTATDRYGNTSTGSFDVTVTNNPPTFTPPVNISQEATAPLGNTVTFVAIGDDIDQGAIPAVCTPASGSVFPVGDTTVNCTVTDVANVSTVGSFLVSIKDTTAPVLTLPVVAPASATSHLGRVMTYVVDNAIDIVDGSRAVTCAPASGDTFPIGTTQVECSVSDARGNIATGSFAVTVTNNAPTLPAPSNITGEATGANGRLVEFNVVGNDTEDGSIGAVCTPASGSIFAIGTRLVSCTVTDIAGAEASASFNVTIEDTTAPALTLPTIAPAFATGPGGRVVDYITSAVDIVDGATGVTCSPTSGSMFPIATTTVNCSSTDSRGNKREGSFTVSITNSAPTIAALPDLTGEATSAAGREFSFTSTGNDPEYGVLIPVCSRNSGTFGIGTTTVTCTVTDVAGYTASDSFTITVSDTTAPVVTVNSITVEQTSPAGAIGNYTASATDVVSGVLTPSCTPAPNTTFARGTHTVTCSATDANGNVGTKTGTVTVADTIKPVVSYTGNAGTYSVDQQVNITCSATDSGSGVASTTCANITGPAYSFSLGVNTRTATATDAAGNTTTTTITFTVGVSADTLRILIVRFEDSSSEATKMLHTLDQAMKAPNATSRGAHLTKLKNDYVKETGKGLTAAEAAILTSLTNQLY